MSKDLYLPPEWRVVVSSTTVSEDFFDTDLENGKKTLPNKWWKRGVCKYCGRREEEEEDLCPSCGAPYKHEI